MYYKYCNISEQTTYLMLQTRLYFRKEHGCTCYKHGNILKCDWSRPILQTFIYFRTNNLANTKTLLYFRTSNVTHTTNKAIFQKGTWPHVLQTWLYISKRLVMANTTDIAIFQNKQRGSCYKQIYIAG